MEGGSRSDKTQKKTTHSVVGNVVTRQYGYERQQLQRRSLTKREVRLLKQQKIKLVLLAVIGSVILFGCCALTLWTKSLNARLADEIMELQEELDTLRKDNDAREENMETSVDLDKIIETAVNELGMQRPRNDQIVYIKSEEDEYIRQVSAVPTK